MPNALLLLLLAVAVAQARPPSPGHPSREPLDIEEAARRARAGQYRLALRAAEAWLEREPEHLSALAVRAESLAGLGRCTQATPLMALLRPTTAWTARLAVLEGECALERGSLSAAEVAFAEALQMHPEAIGALHGHARVLGLLRDPRHSATLAALMAHEDGGHRDVIIRSQVAVELALEDIDAEVATALRVAETSASPKMLQNALMADGMRWLDVGDPVMAEARFGEAAPLLPGRVQPSILRAESLRRLGQAEGAALILQQPRIAIQTSTLKDAVWIRILIDLGRTAEARAALAELGADTSVDALASAWYVATADRRDQEAAVLASLTTGFAQDSTVVYPSAA